MTLEEFKVSFDALKSKGFIPTEIERLQKVHLLWHTHTDERLPGGENVKLLGTYSSRENAETAQAEAAVLAGFKDHLEGFEISEYDLDERQWREGFTTETWGSSENRCFIGEVGHWITIEGKVKSSYNYEYRTLMAWAKSEEAAKIAFEKDANAYTRPYKNMYGQDVCYVFDKVHFVRESWFFDTEKLDKGDVLEVDSRVKDRRFPKNAPPMKPEDVPKAAADNEFYNLLSHWRRFAEQYADTQPYIYEWQNDMDARRLIDAHLATLPNNQKELKRHIQQFDKLVLAKTFEVNECIWGEKVEKENGYNRKTNWYYYRVNQAVFDAEKGVFTKK
ncbi:MAG: hypothetical protein U5L45_18445 [Saprospiraceae bacterium]|nr:hypothetical protein [Saprospiraceae bacterium]